VIPGHWRAAALAPPRAWGAPVTAGRLRSVPEDFVVEEILGFEASGAGPHALLTVRKRGANTEWVARELARVAGCKPFEVGFAGLKDRMAVTTQAFSVPRGRRDAQEFLGVMGEGFEVLAAAAHQRKLPRGALCGNRFSIKVRELHCDPARLRERIAALAAGGVPNYFGPQRFGRDAANLAAVLRAAGDDRQRGGGRGFVLSAARSVVFNAILAERVADGSWNRLLPGDVANLDGTGSVFRVEHVDPGLEARCAEFDVHPTGPLAGEGESLASGSVRELEESVAARFPEALAMVRAERMRSERRPLRMRVSELAHEQRDDVLWLRFTLPAGSFATAVLREIIASEQNEE
jgi:tRNA pseudouridine13 synthase